MISANLPTLITSSCDDPERALAEMRRVCKPNGRILLLEHGRSSYDWLSQTLDRNAEQHAAAWGCWWNRDIDRLLHGAGLDLVSYHRWHLGECSSRLCLPETE